MRINQNIPAMNAQRVLGQTSKRLSRNLERLSSGLRINRAADDASGLAISEKMRTQVRGLSVAIKNAEDGVSLVQTAEGALSETHDILQRMHELAVQAANGTLTTADRENLQEEYDASVAEIVRIAETTDFNTQVLLDGDFSGVALHIGANSITGDLGKAANVLSVTIGNMTASATGTGSGLEISGLSITTITGAQDAIDLVETAITSVSTQRAELGAVQNRLEHSIRNLGVQMENMAAAESQIRDLDIAQETADFTKNQILLQAGTAILAQANLAPQAVLQLLG